LATGTQYLALLRGINVGGKNPVKMANLRECFEGLGFDDVSTYINSGNVLFRAPRQKADELATRIEAELTRTLGIDLKIVLRTRAQLESVVANAPNGFGDPAYRCDVIFLRKPLTAKRAFGALEMRDGVDRAWSGKGVLYFSRLDAKASSSKLSKFVMTPEYQDVTIRSWSTTTKLAALMAAA
jgi:uncharacterized protein (DUF1697 family)